MADAVSITRSPALAGRSLQATGVSLVAAPPAARVSLRAPESSAAAFSQAIGMSLPQRPKTSAGSNGRVALWLGPDEWLVIDTNGGDPLAACRTVPDLHSAVDVSHRNVAILLSGKGAAATLNAGCPQDLSLHAFPVGACSRTILGKIEIVLWRMSEDEFHMECWRSFGDYAWDFLSEAARDAAA